MSVPHRRSDIAPAAALALVLYYAATCAVASAQIPAQTETLPALVPIRTELVITSYVVQTFDSVADAAPAAQMEAFLCGLGATIQGRTFVDMLFVPRVLEATPTSVSPWPCPVATMLEWHTHLPVLPNEPALVTPKHRCFYSIDDIKSALRPGNVAPFHMVHVQKGVYCWWTYAQIVEHVARWKFSRVLAALPEQSSWLRQPEKE